MSVTNNSTNTPFQFNKGDLIGGQGGGSLPAIVPVGVDGLVLTANSGSPTGVAWQAAGLSAFAVNVQVFTSSGTYTPTPGMAFAMIEVVGGGGGGGGINITALNQSASGGGGAGGYVRQLFTAADIGVSQAVTIGTAGSGGIGNNPGGAGGTTSVGALLSATGGSGGSPGNNTGTVGGGLGGTGIGVGPTGFVTVGAPGGLGVCFTATSLTGTNGFSGEGGSSFFGGGGIQIPVTANSDGQGARSYGGGGGGAASTGNLITRTGGFGYAGIVIITEWIT